MVGQVGHCTRGHRVSSSHAGKETWHHSSCFWDQRRSGSSLLWTPGLASPHLHHSHHLMDSGTAGSLGKKKDHLSKGINIACL
ncbi:unnamed protein product [Gulo gulo]|uniref:Uncharacterized protein n=1 Tax=Gulo gulo TaxID=48420 RepID=A0A9X9M6B7_GULGU|nr:unnamed protein product [Gulo gulo]